MKCPRCGESLREIEPGPIYLRHFVCDDCWRAWRLEIFTYTTSDEQNPRIRFRKTDTTLVFGRNQRIDLAGRTLR